MKVAIYDINANAQWTGPTKANVKDVDSPGMWIPARLRQRRQLGRRLRPLLSLTRLTLWPRLARLEPGPRCREISVG